MVPGKRTAENTEAVVRDFKQRTGGRPMNLITSDEYKALPESHFEGLRRAGRAEADGKAGPAQGHVLQTRGHVELRHSSQDTEQGAGSEDRLSRHLRSRGGRHDGVEVVEGEQQNQHGVRGTSQRNRP